MTILENLKDKKVLLVGYGIDGKATEKYLKKHIPNIDLTITDRKDGPDYLKNQSEFDIAIASPGTLKDRIKIPWDSSTNIFFEECKGTIIGITGTKGKSTTAKLVYEILKAAGKKTVVLGNIGTALLEALDKSNDPGTYYVAELSSYQLENYRYSPHIAVVTSLYPDHIPNHGSLEKYYSAKQNIVKYQKNTDHFVFEKGNSVVSNWETEAQKHPVESLPEAAANPKFIAYHHWLIAGFATKVSEILGIDDTTIKNAINSFEPLPHRLEYVGKFRKIEFYDDGAATIPEATIAAIKTLPGVKTLLIGGHDRGYDFSELAEVIVVNDIRNIILFPETGEKIRQLLLEKSDSFNFYETSAMEDAVRWAYKNTPEGSICLLSTAATSYNLWKNFNEKGDEFQKWVKRFGEGN